MEYRAPIKKYASDKPTAAGQQKNEHETTRDREANDPQRRDKQINFFFQPESKIKPLTYSASGRGYRWKMLATIGLVCGNN